MFRFAIMAAFAALFAAPVAAHDYTSGDLVIAHPYARATTSQAQMAGGFMTITNTGEFPDRLLSVEGDFARTVEVHLTHDVDGVMQMREVETGLEIPPGQSVTLRRGSYHVMFMGLAEPLRQGDSHEATLIFERAGAVPISFKVEPFNYVADGDEGHRTHDNHSGHGNHDGHDHGSHDH